MFIGLHNHSDHSNYRLRDSINTTSQLLKYSKEIGHNGIAITEHETIGSSLEIYLKLQELREKEPDKWNDYKLIFGNEIYLCNRKQIQEDKDYVFPHFILLAKDAVGHKQIRELSARAWISNSFFWVMYRVPTFYDDLFEIISANRGHVIASTACLGGSLPKQILKIYHENPENPDYSICVKWINKMKKLFGDDNFYLELQPSTQEDQFIVDKALIQLSKETNTPYIISTDSHYLKKEDKDIHEAFVNSQEGDRELGSFYDTTYVMSEKEIHEYLDNIIGYENVEIGFANTIKIGNMCEEYDLRKPLNIPYIPSNTDEPNILLYKKYVEKIPLLKEFYESEYDSDRHLVREIINKFEANQEELCNQKTYDELQVNLNAIKVSSDKAKTRWSGYLLQTKELIDLCWESGTIVCPSRGSGGGFLLLYILGIIQINPLREKAHTYYWRFLNPERVSVLDIDVDIRGDMKETVLQNLKKKYGGDRHVSKVQTLSTEKAKSAILTACRGLKVDNDTASFLASFIQGERGIQYTLQQVFYGDADNNISPNQEFINLMTNDYPQVWKVAQKIEGLINGVGSHAGGVILCKEDMVNNTSLMKTNSGDIITQFNLHSDEAVSLIKWDLLATDAMQKIQICLSLMLKDDIIQDQGNLRETYEHYLGVYKIDRTSPEMWEMIRNHKIFSFFQMEKQSGYQAIELGQPESVEDLAALNSVMRLMSPSPDAESPLQRYSRYKKDISLWYKEMDEFGLTKEEQLVVEKYAKANYGLLPNQEDFMMIVQDPAVGGMGLLWADRLRKSIAKKSPKDYVKLQEEFYKNMEDKHLSYNLCHYVWDVLISMNRGYGFNTAHTLAYSIVGLQEANLAYHYPIVYWNAANLISDSGGEDGTTNYGKIAQAIGHMQSEGIKIALPDINRAGYDFKPDAKNNEIIFGFKGLQSVGDKIAKAIISYQPYQSMNDFYNKMQDFKEEEKENKFGNTTMISLIKAGCFDELEEKSRKEVMRDFITKIASPLTSLKLSNIEDLKELGLLTDAQKNYELRMYRFRNYIFDKKNFVGKKGKSANTEYYKLDRKFAEPYFFSNFETNLEENKDYEYNDEGFICVKKGSFDREYKKLMTPFKTEILDDPKMLIRVNENKIDKIWEDKELESSISKWEMDSLSFYYHEHELAHVNKELYNIVNFNDLSAQSKIAGFFNYRGKPKPRFELSRICGTVLDKNKDKAMIVLLTPDGIVNVKFYKGQFAFYDKQISEVDEETGKKTVLEKTWFSRGTKLLITGYRREEQFVPKQYKDSIYKHSLQLITQVNDDGTLKLISERVGMEDE